MYSKKVEHLHGLVHQALSVISDKRCACTLLWPCSQAAAQVMLPHCFQMLPPHARLQVVHDVQGNAPAYCRQRTEAGGQPTGDDIDEFDDEETFLNLDDVLQGATAPKSTPSTGQRQVSQPGLRSHHGITRDSLSDTTLNKQVVLQVVIND